MVDSVIAGTGNSRYLRTSLSASTTWEDALTMLRAGTFPIDLAGINLAGFTTLGTALNSATLLKSAVITALGLDADATPSDAWDAVIALISEKADADSTVTSVAYNSSTHKLTVTIDGVTTDVVTITPPPVNSVNTKTGDVVLGSGDIAYSDSATYPSGSVGAEVADLKSAIGDGGENILAAYPTDTASGAVASFPDGAALPVKDLTIAINPVQSGSGDPAPDNVRPISGWTGANVTRTGKNLLPKFSNHSASGLTFSVGEDGSVSVSGTSTAGNVSVNYWLPDTLVKMLAGKTVMLSGGGSSAAYIQMRLVASSTTYKTTAASGKVSFAVPADVTQIRVDINVPTSGTTVSSVFYPQLEFGSTDTAYEPYAGTTLPISWQSEAGTVYGGTLDVLTGVLTARPYYASYNGETLVGPWVSSMDKYVAGATPTTGAQVVDLGGAPTTVQLDPETLSTLLGANNIWADTGDVSVNYRADTTLYIDKLTGSTEEDMIADAPIASGKYFLVGNRLFLSTASIAAGAQLTIGTNCTETNLAAALNALNS